jgi:hypothetical protein
MDICLSTVTYLTLFCLSIVSTKIFFLCTHYFISTNAANGVYSEGVCDHLDVAGLVCGDAAVPAHVGLLA